MRFVQIMSLKFPKCGNQLSFMEQQVPYGRVSNSLSIPHKFSSLALSSLIASTCTSRICEGRFGLIVITKALTIKVLACSFLLKESAITFALPRGE
nr:hypothetical protein [Tanacetum cinerariifolium]